MTRVEAFRVGFAARAVQEELGLAGVEVPEEVTAALERILAVASSYIYSDMSAELCQPCFN